MNSVERAIFYGTLPGAPVRDASLELHGPRLRPPTPPGVSLRTPFRTPPRARARRTLNRAQWRGLRFRAPAGAPDFAGAELESAPALPGCAPGYTATVDSAGRPYCYSDGGRGLDLTCDNRPQGCCGSIVCIDNGPGPPHCECVNIDDLLSRSATSSSELGRDASPDSCPPGHSLIMADDGRLICFREDRGLDLCDGRSPPCCGAYVCENDWISGGPPICICRDDARSANGSNVSGRGLRFGRAPVNATPRPAVVNFAGRPAPEGPRNPCGSCPPGQGCGCVTLDNKQHCWCSYVQCDFTETGCIWK